VIPVQATAGRWRPHLTPWLAYLKLPSSYWLVINELCRRQGGSRAVVRAGALSLAEATGVSERQVYRVLRTTVDLGLLEPEWIGGGSKNPGGAGLATEYRLAPRARQQPGAPYLQVLKKGDKDDTLSEDKKGDKGDTLSGDKKGDKADTPDMRKYDSLRSSSSADRKGGPDGADYEPDWAGSSPAIDGYLAERRALIKAAADRERGGAIADLLATEPIEAIPDLDFDPPKRKRR
jgi:hypothetical protein